MYGMTFNGVKKDYVVTLRGKRRPPWAPLDRELIEIPGYEGAYVGDTSVKPRPLDIPILIETNSLAELQTVKEDLAAWLVTDQPKELVLEDEPDRTYFAMIDKDVFDVEELIRVGLGILKFICPDPAKYGPLQTLTPNATDLSMPIILDVNGTKNAPATFEVELKEATTHLDFITDTNYLRLGRVVDETNYGAPKFERIFWEEFNDIGGWTYNTDFNLDGTPNTPQGTITSNGYSIRPGSIGTGTGWHGPAIVKQLPETLDDFKIRLRLELNNPSHGMMGRMELYLLDDAFDVAAKVSLRDRTQARDGNYIEVRAGSGQDENKKFLINERGDKWWVWLNFDGLIELTREGNMWTALAAKIDHDTNEQHSRRYRTWRDVGNRHTRNIKYVMVHMSGYNDYPVNPMNIQDLKVYKINELANEAIPYIGDEGDIFKVDMRRKAIFKNGALFNNKAFASNFFDLKPGINSIVMNPPSAIDNVGVNWRSRYK